jgi:signal transduction histidine kinase
MGPVQIRFGTLALAACLMCFRAFASHSDSILNLPYDQLGANLASSERSLRAIWIDASKAGDLWRRAKAADLLSTVQYLGGAYDSSAFYLLDAIALYQELKMPAALGQAYCEYGYRIKRRNLDEAFRYMIHGIGILENNVCHKELTAAYDNYGVLHEFKNNLDSAEWYYHRALELKENLNDSIGIPYSLNNLGGIQIIRGHYDEAYAFIQRGMQIRRMRNDGMGEAESCTLMGELHQAWGKWPDAIEWFLRSASICSSLGYPYLLQQNQQQLARCYEETGQFALATQALKASMALKDSLLNETNLKTVNELEQRFNLAEKDKSIALLQEQSAKRMMMVAWITVVFVLLAAGLVVLLQRNKRRAAAARDAAIIAERERGLEAVYSATEEERKRIAKDLHDGVGQQLSGLRMGFESLTSEVRTVLPQKGDVIDRLTRVIDEACADVRSLSHQMMPKALSESGLIASLEDMLTKSLGVTPIQFRLEHYKVQGVRFPEKVELGIYRVCQELVNNIIKHSGASEVVVQVFRNRDMLILIVEDNGRGFVASRDGNGIGLTNITSRMRTVDGEVTWEPGPQSGTVATVKVPVQPQS